MGMFIPKYTRYSFFVTLLNNVIFNSMKADSNTQNVPIMKDTHKLLVAHAQQVEGKIYKIADKAIREYLEKNPKRES